MILHGPSMVEIALIGAAWLVVFIVVWVLITLLVNFLRR